MEGAVVRISSRLGELVLELAATRRNRSGIESYGIGRFTRNSMKGGVLICPLDGVVLADNHGNILW